MAFTSIISFLIFFCVTQFKIQLNAFTIMMAVIMDIIAILSEIVCFTAYGKGPISQFTVFQMQGGMLLPFLYGVSQGDNLTPPKILGILIMTVALILTVSNDNHQRQKLSKIFIFLCVMIFFINGSVSIGSYIYSNNSMTMGPANFIMIKSAILGVTAIIVWSAARLRYREKIASKELVFRNGLLICACAMDNISYFLQLVSAAHLSSTVLYPVVTGGTVVLTAIAGHIFFHEKHSKKAIIGFILSFVATVLFAF